MRLTTQVAMTLVLAAILPTLLCAQPSTRLAGTVTAVNARGLTVKPDAGESVLVVTGAGTRVQRVQPGERDLTKAETIALSDVAAGDRVLVRAEKSGETLEAKSVIVMSARAIAKRHEDERQMWQQRGVFGVVEHADAAAGTVTLTVKSRGESSTLTVTTTDKTSVRRYAADSIRFADAAVSSIAEMRKGDQVRVLGDKSGTGAVAAEQMVFGTFRTVAGTVTSVSPAGEVSIKDVQSGRMLTVAVRPDSQIKRFATTQGPMGMGMRPDIGAMLDKLPAAKIDELKTGEAVIVSSTTGAQPDRLTAIVMLAGAEPVLAQLTARAAAQRGQDPLAGSSGLDRGLDGMMGMPVQ